MDIKKWDRIVGASNGATLALQYASTFPDNVERVVLRGYWSVTPEELSWDYFGPGKRNIFPLEWKIFCDVVNCDSDSNLLKQYFEALKGTPWNLSHGSAGMH